MEIRGSNESEVLVDWEIIENGMAKVVVVDVNNVKNGRKPVKLQKESPAGCAGEGKQSKGN